MTHADNVRPGAHADRDRAIIRHIQEERAALAYLVSIGAGDGFDAAVARRELAAHEAHAARVGLVVPDLTTYRVRFADFAANTEHVVNVPATSLGEALTLAERHVAGLADVAIAIPAEHYADARAEGIAFNEADGLVIL